MSDVINKRKDLQKAFDALDLWMQHENDKTTGRWTPCSKRLPDDSDYNSCMECMDGAVWYCTENGTVGLGYYYESTKEWSTTDDLKTDGKVIAWMSLPKPYRGEQDE